MANTTEQVPETASASPIILSQLRGSRHGSLTSLSTASRLDKETRAQTLDQIHNSACNTDTLTTFNEYTSPPSAASGVDAKGIASDLHGGLSGLYNRLRASVGNVRDIVSHMTEDGSPGDRTLRDPQLPISSTAHSNRQPADSAKASTPSTDSLSISQGSVAEHLSLPENLGLDPGKKEKDHQSISTKISVAATGLPSQISSQNISLPSASIVPGTQASTKAADLPALTEVNVKATKEQHPSEELLSNILVAKSITPSKPPLALPAESFSSPSVDRQNLEISTGSFEGTESSKIQKDQVSRSMLDNTPNAIAWLSDKTANNRSKYARKSGLANDNDRVLPDPGLHSIGEPIHIPPKPSSGINQDKVEASRIITNPVFSRGNSLTGTQAGEKLGDAATEQSLKQKYQHSELLVNKSSAPSQIRLTRAPNSHHSQASRESVATGLLNTSRQNLPSNDPGEDNAGRRASQLKTQVTFPQSNEARTLNVFSQIKSKILNKEYWMRDENARDCFYCGDPFSTFRRKHHCSR